MSNIEQQIIDLMKKRDKRFISLLYDHYTDSLYGIVLRMLNDEALAQDVIQDSFVKIWKNADSYDPDRAKLFTWILRICRNTALDKMRSLKSRGKHEIQTEDSNVYDNRTSNYNPDVMDLKKHLSSLEDKYVEVINALFYKGMTQKEASEALNLPLGTIKTRLKIGLRELRKVFSEKELVVCLLLTIIG